MWTYGDTVCHSRKAALSSPVAFENIVASIVVGMQVLCGHNEISCDDNRFGRVVYCVRISKSLFDVFFNSSNSYRAQYFKSVEHGLCRNRFLIQTLSPALLASGKLSSLPKEKIQKSLGVASAKVWLAEVEKHICNECYGEWSFPQDGTAEILNGRWENTSNWCGRKAPLCAKIRVFGGFLNDNGYEYVPQGKKHRAEEIQDTGWS